jgi:hypothetical protein
MYSYYYFNFIKNNPDKPWNWRLLSRNPNITFDIVLKNPDKPWDWRWLSQNPNIKLSILYSKTQISRGIGGCYLETPI